MTATILIEFDDATEAHAAYDTIERLPEILSGTLSIMPGLLTVAIEEARREERAAAAAEFNTWLINMSAATTEKHDARFPD